MTWGTWYWPVALAACVAVIMGPEVFALIHNPRNTLSDWVWKATGAARGVPITSWSAAHFFIGGVLLIGMVWLFGHLIFHLWT